MSTKELEKQKSVLEAKSLTLRSTGRTHEKLAIRYMTNSDAMDVHKREKLQIETKLDRRYRKALTQLEIIFPRPLRNKTFVK